MTPSLSLLKRAQGAYLGMAVGDALGATVEFMTPREIRVAYGTHHAITGGGWLKLAPGQVTDDTEMALALGDAILLRKRVEARAVAEAFDSWMRSKPVDIGNTVRRGIVRFRRTGETEVPVSDGDAGNGACMRVLPVALATLGQPAGVVEQAVREQSHITHNNPLSDAGTLCVVRLIQMAFDGEVLSGLLHGPVADLAKKEPLFNFRKRREENPSGYIVHTLRAVFQAFFDTDSLQACLVDVVNRGGDADTTGAIAGMIAGAFYGVEAIPDIWLRALQAPVKLRCEAQAAGLLQLANG